MYITVQYFNTCIIIHNLQYGKTPLDYARGDGHHDVVDYLVTLGKFVVLINDNLYFTIICLLY